MVIVIGLYLVIWGKSKDGKEVELIEQQADQKQEATDFSTKDDHHMVVHSKTNMSPHNAV